MEEQQHEFDSAREDLELQIQQVKEECDSQLNAKQQECLMIEQTLATKVRDIEHLQQEVVSIQEERQIERDVTERAL